MTTPAIPFDEVMEESALGAVLTDPKAYYLVAGVIRQPEDFFLVRHQHIWRAITELAAKSTAFDYQMVGHVLQSAGQLDAIGGLPALVKLVNNTPTSAHAATYAQMVRRLAIRRRILSAAEEIKKTVHDTDLSLEQAVERVEQQIFTALSDGTESRTVHIKQAASDYYEQVLAIQRGDQEYLGIPTGFKGLDAITKGAQRGQLIYLAGRPGMGKTALALNFAVHAAKLNQRVFIWSGEMNVRENMARLVAAETAIDTQRLQLGNMSQEEISRFTEASLKRLPDWKLWIDDTAGITVQRLHAMLTRHTMLYGLDMVVVDYVGLLRAVGRHNRTEEMGEISRSLKRMAMDLNVPLVVAAQLNRGCEDRNDKRPMLRDLRDSGDLEQDANVIMFLYRDVVYNANTDNPDLAEVIVAKNRNGPTGTAMLKFNRSITRFENAQLQQVSLKDHTF